MRSSSGARLVVALLVVGLVGLIGAGAGAVVGWIRPGKPDWSAPDVARTAGRGAAGGVLLALAGTAWWLLETAKRRKP